MTTVRQLFADILPEEVESVIKRIETNQSSIKSAISLVIKSVMVFLTVFITVLDSMNIAVIIIPTVNLVNIFIVRRLTRKPDVKNIDDLQFGDCDGVCPVCKIICSGRCEIMRDMLKSIWTQTLLITDMDT